MTGKQHFQIKWQDLDIEVLYCRSWSNSYEGFSASRSRTSKSFSRTKRPCHSRKPATVRTSPRRMRSKPQADPWPMFSNGWIGPGNVRYGKPGRKRRGNTRCFKTRRLK